jgi:hypothetical protein
MYEKSNNITNKIFAPFLVMEDEKIFRPKKLDACQNFLITEGAENNWYFRRIFRNICLKIFTGRQIYIRIKYIIYQKGSMWKLFIKQ